MSGVNVGTAYLEIIPSAKGFAGKLQSEVGGGMAKSGAESGKKFGEGFGGSLKSTIGAAVAAVGLTELAGKAVDFMKDSVAEARESQKVGALTANVIKTTGGAAKVTADQVGDLATAISNKTGIDDEAIQSGANMLLTFKNIRNETGKGNDIFNQSTSILTDMATAMGSDPQKAAIQLGKALNDPVKGVSALGRVGVTFTDQQKKTIKSLVDGGKTAEAQKIILKELGSEFGGAAEASATAGEKLATTWGNFKENIGTAVLPMLDKLETFLSGKLIPGVQGVIDILFKGDFTKGFREAFNVEEDSKVVDWLFNIRDAFTTVKTAAKDFWAGLTLKDAKSVGAPLEGFVATGQKVRTAFEKLRPSLTRVWDAAKKLWPSIRDIAKQLYAAYSKIGLSPWSQFKVLLEHLPGIIDTLATALSGAAKWMGEHKTLVGALVTGLGTALALFKAYKITMTVVSGVTKAYTAVQTLLNIVMAANPIGIVVIALAALVGGLIYAYNTSETFRSYVSTAFSVVKIGAMLLVKAAVTYFQFLGNVWMTVVGVLLDGAAQAFGWVPGIGPKLQGAADSFHKFKDSANASLDKIKNDIDVKINTEQANIALEALHRDFINKGWTVTAEVNTRMVYGANGKLVPAPRAFGGPVSAGGAYAVGDNPDGSWNKTTELFVPDRPGHIYNQKQLAGMGGGGLSQNDIQRLAVAMSQVQVQAKISAGSVDRQLGARR